MTLFGNAAMFFIAAMVIAGIADRHRWGLAAGALALVSICADAAVRFSG